MSRNERPDWDNQFSESEEERNSRLRQRGYERTLETLWCLIGHLSDGLRDEGCDWSVDGLQQMRRRVANALPPDKCPDWLEQYRDPPVMVS